MFSNFLEKSILHSYICVYIYIATKLVLLEAWDSIQKGLGKKLRGCEFGLELRKGCGNVPVSAGIGCGLAFFFIVVKSVWKYTLYSYVYCF